jgi:hypothetical protein
MRLKAHTTTLAHLLTLSLFTPTWTDAKPSEAEFRLEISTHRSRVLEMGLKVTEEFLDQFKALASLSSADRSQLMRAYLSLHDLPKLMTEPQLAQLNYEGPKTIFQNLYEVYGVSFETQPQFIADLNTIEKQLKEKKMQLELSKIDPDLRSSLWQEMRRIEDVVDFTDTRILRGAELGFVPQPFSSTDYFLSLQMPVAARIAQWLEENHYPLNVRDSKKRLRS